MGNIFARSKDSSKAAAADKTLLSLRGAPAICNPTGKPDLVNPQSMDIAGEPITVKA